jgi:hypothetical protein
MVRCTARSWSEQVLGYSSQGCRHNSWLVRTSMSYAPGPQCSGLLFFFLSVLGLELRGSCLLGFARQARFHFELLHQLCFLLGFFEIVSCTICLRLASNCDPSDLCLLSSKDYRSEPSVPDCSGLLSRCFHCLEHCILLGTQNGSRANVSSFAIELTEAMPFVRTCRRNEYHWSREPGAVLFLPRI